MNRQTTVLLSAFALVIPILAIPNTSRACGGCFGPVDQASVVTAHRMAIALSPTETTLWDQFEYAGDPEDFVWVLPVNGGQEVRIELADNAFFQILQAMTQEQLAAEFQWGDEGSGGGFGCGGAYAVDAAGGGGPSSPPVVVYNQEVVGPYETVTLGSEDEGALVGWLRDNGYDVPESMLPVIGHYVEAGSNFVVLRLAPGEGITRMQPVRVTMPGMSTTFPLRMVSAGISGRVSLELFVLGEGRYEAANFGNTQIDPETLTYDWDTDTFNYLEQADLLLEENGGRTWLTEAAIPWDRGRGVPATWDGEGNRVEAEEDWNVVFTHLYELTVTRMRADLAVSDLDEDLYLTASAEAELNPFYLVPIDQQLNVPEAASAALTAEDGASLAWLPGGPGAATLVAAALGLLVRRRRKR